jgi:hypothetical protein
MGQCFPLSIDLLVAGLATRRELEIELHLLRCLSEDESVPNRPISMAAGTLHLAPLLEVQDAVQTGIGTMQHIAKSIANLIPAVIR